MTFNRYCNSNCTICRLNDRCMPGQQRGVTRWEQQDVLDGMWMQLEQS